MSGLPLKFKFCKNETPEINEVILSGGDPLSLADAQLERLLNEIEKSWRGKAVITPEEYLAVIQFAIF